ncbi:O-antigen ligase family protein [Microaerobacter geothermalis]|uniref:O-antigen ligase family protein n=1 Tax=Microaerobacter geothermalis TaxID=674972 RepID=UPI001F157625|nr:O-antigen ligase family protein [Microaerobacter geothermalis]MCF6093275.1 O-antigen ligase family protein [Microaerobacter geothermalis]
MNWVILFIPSLIFLYTPYQRGLFFDSDLYIWEVLIASLFIIVAVIFLFKKSEMGKGFYFIVFLLPVTYILSLTVAESPKGGLDNLFRWTSYVSFFILLVWARQTNKVEKLLPYIFHLTGIWVALFALFGLWGWVDFRDVVLGGRLTGPFQYYNTFAALVSAFWIFALVILTQKKLSIWKVIFFSLPVVAFGVGLFHSYSRGALLVFPLAWFIGLTFLRGKQQLIYSLYTFISLGGSFLAFRQIAEQSKIEGIDNPGSTGFFLISLVVLLLITGIHYLLNYRNNTLLERIDKKPYIRFVLPGVIIVLGVLLVLDLQNKGLVYQQLPPEFQDRISSINADTSSVVGRTTFFEDALRMSKDAPFLGLGGDGWRILFTKYQQVPYWSNETHNGYLEILLNTGWFGLIIFILVFGFLFYQILRRIWSEKEDEDRTIAIATIPALVMIFAHSFIDFNFSYGSVWFIVFWLFAMGVTDQPMRFFVADQTVASGKKMKGKSASSRWKNPEMIYKTILGITAVFVLIMGIYSFRFYLAEKQAARAQGTLNLEEAKDIFEKATSYNPYHVDYQFNLANVYVKYYKTTKSEDYKEKAIKTLQKVEDLEPHNPKALFNIGNIYGSLGDGVQAIQYFEKALEYDRYNVKFYDAIIRLKSQAAVQMLQEKNVEKALEYAQGTVDDYEEYRTLTEPFKKTPVPDQRPVLLEKSTHLFVGQSYLLLGDFNHTIDALKPINNKDDQDTFRRAQAIRVVAYEALGNKQEAAKITTAMQKDFPNFMKYVEAYKAVPVTSRNLSN